MDIKPERGEMSFLDRQATSKRRLGAFEDAVFKIKQNKKVILLWEMLLRFACGFLLSKAVIFGEYAPFGVAFSAMPKRASGTISSGLGAFLGYILVEGGVDGLKYAAATILTCAAVLIFRGTEAEKVRIFPSLIAGVSLFCVGFVFIAERGFSLYDIMLSASEIALAMCAVFFGRYAFSEESESVQEYNLISIGKAVIAALLLLVIYPFSIFGTILPARVVTAAAVMITAFKWGGTKGAAFGIAAGAIMDIAGTGSPFFIAAYGFSAMIAGAFNKKGKLVFALLYVVSNAAISVWGIEDPRYLPGLYEAFMASVGFVLLADRFNITAEGKKEKAERAHLSEHSDKLRNHFRKKMTDVASAFYETYKAIAAGMNERRMRNDEDVASVFDYSAEKVCRKCAIRDACWERDYITTFNALNDASVEIMKRGYAKEEDFPAHFSGRCLNFAAFIAAVNEATATLIQRRYYKARITENKELIRDQFAGISGILRRVAAEMEAGPEFHFREEEKIARMAIPYGGAGKITVYTSPSGRMHVELADRDLSEIMDKKDEFMMELQESLSKRFCEPEEIMTDEGFKITFSEAETYSAVIGAAVRKKQSEAVSGDRETYFKTEDGRMYMLLSDGMGSGEKAAAESETTIKLLEKFLKAGIEPEEAIKTVRAALAIKNDNVGAATIDIVCVNLFSGECKIIKYGAAPSYIKKGRKASRVTLGDDMDKISGEPSVVKINLREGDSVIMISDGVCDALEDEWIFPVIEGMENTSPKKMAGAIIEKASKNDRRDDMTAVVMTISKRGYKK